MKILIILIMLLVIIMIVNTRHSPSPNLPCPCLSWPALSCPGPSWQGYHTKLTVVPPPTSTLRVVVAVDGFWVGIFVFSLLFTNSYQPNFEIPMGHMKRLYSSSIINIRQLNLQTSRKAQIINVILFRIFLKISLFALLRTILQLTHWGSFL